MPLFQGYSIDLNKKIKAGLGASLIILIFSSILAYYSINKLITQNEWVNHTYKVINNLESVISNVKDAETGQRGYLLTGDSSFLSPYIGSFGKIHQHLNTIKALTNNDEEQQQNLDTLNQIISARFQKLENNIKSFGSGNVISIGQLRAGREIMLRTRELTDRMIEKERELLNNRTREVEKFRQLAPFIILLSSLLAMLISGVSLFFISKDIKNREMAQEELNNLNKTLIENNEELEKSKTELNKRNFILSGNEELNNALRGEKDLKVLSNTIVKHFCEFVKAQAGVVYLLGENSSFYAQGGYSFDRTFPISSVYKRGEGLVGQAAIEKRVFLIENIPADSMRIETGLTMVKPVNILIIPLNTTEETLAVIELASINAFTEEELEYIENVRDKLAIIIYGAKAENKTSELLNETQSQAEELQAQQEELRQINDELREQQDKLQASEEELRVSQEELQEKNVELEEKASELQEQYDAIRIKNTELENARSAVQLKMEQVETMNKYKSEFLANMSHELRTPLNSILILAKVLSDNRDGNLSGKQVEFSQIIHDSGNDLLRLINDILDLAKIESGKINLELAEFPLKELGIETHFEQLAKEKGIKFSSIFDDSLPEIIYNDKFRVNQILKNLLSNAFKFTKEGGQVIFHLYSPGKNVHFLNKNLENAKKIIAFAVEDTGIGIPEDKQKIIFEAFQQGDSSTTRKFGGTGLGLSISRELATLLGGEIHVESEKDKGSKFTLYLPQGIKQDDRASKSKPALDFQNNEVKNIPVKEVVPAKPAAEENKSDANEGNTGAVIKRLNNILIVEDDKVENMAVKEFLLSNNILSESSYTGKEAIDKLKSQNFDGIILDINLPDMPGNEVIENIRKDPTLRDIPVIIYSGKDLSEEEVNNFKKYTNTIIVKTDFSYKRLLEEINFILKREGKKKTNDDQNIKFHKADESLKGKKVLVVDDDMRNIFSLYALLEKEAMNIVVANNGKQALEKLEEHPDIRIVLMDIMMPEMDGLECTRRIRNSPKFSRVPVIAVTAKAMKEDRERSIEAGASDYVTKPIDVNKLISLMRVWVYQQGSQE